jgi:hypothetical protein
MKKFKIPVQLTVALGIVVIGGGALLTEYSAVKWWPLYRQHVQDKMTELLPYQNDSLGVKMQVARSIYGRVEDFPGGTKIYRRGVFHSGPVLTLTSQPNPDSAFEFSPQLLADWETRGTYQKIPDYNFEHLKIEDRDAALIWHAQSEGYLVTAHIISPDRIIEADCSTGDDEVAIMLQACQISLKTIQVAGPMPPPEAPSGVMELRPNQTAPAKH